MLHNSVLAGNRNNKKAVQYISTKRQMKMNSKSIQETEDKKVIQETVQNKTVVTIKEEQISSREGTSINKKKTKKTPKKDDKDNINSFDSNNNNTTVNKEEKTKSNFMKSIFSKKPKEEKSPPQQYRMSNALLLTLTNFTDCSSIEITNETEVKTDLKASNSIPIIMLNGEEILELDKYIKTSNLKQCLVGGDGLEKCHVDKHNSFYIETEDQFDKKKAFVSIKGPKQPAIKMETRLLDSNLCKFTYWPRKNGVYIVTVKYEDRHVTGSPFNVKSEPVDD